MNKFDFQEYLYEHIPAVQKMGFKVVSFDEGPVKLWASLEENINHEMKAFGGSISSLLIMACWSQVYKIMLDAGHACKILIQQSQVDYIRTIEEDFVAVCQPPIDSMKENFISSFKRFGKARINLISDIYIQGQLASRFQGRFVALEQ